MKNRRKQQMLLVAISILIFTSKALGLLPFYWNKNTQSLARYRWPIVIPLVLVFAMTFLINYSNSIVTPLAQTQYSSNGITLVLNVMTIVYSLTLGLTYVTHYCTLHDIEAMFADSVTIYRTLNQLKINMNDPSWLLFAMFTVNFLFIPLMQFAIIYYRTLSLHASAAEHYALVGITSVPSLITSLVPNLFYNCMMVVLHVLQVLNDALRAVMAATAHMDAETPFRRQQRCCDLSDAIDAIAQVHLQVTLLAQRITDLLKMNLVLWMLFRACSVMVTLFTCYMYCVGWALFDTFEMPIQVLVLGIISSYVMLAEMLCFTHLCWKTMNEVIFTIDI